MNTTWLTLSRARRIDILNQTTERTGLPAIAIEKDWWVTLCLKASFSLSFSENIVFKGGTSLSKGWNLIDRFSEDIDLAIDRTFFGFSGDISKTQIRKLRKKSCEFISTEFITHLIRIFTDWGAIKECKLFAETLTDSDRDPQVIEIQYNSVVDTSDYLPQRVLIEIGSRSLMEPAEQRQITSILSENFPSMNFSSAPFLVSTVLPQRTFLEKIFLLHEEFSQESNKIRIDKISRHLYDIERLMDTPHGVSALNNKKLYNNIIAHRKKFNALKGVDYSKHSPDKISITPPESTIIKYQIDYTEMTKFMIYGNFLSFGELISRVAELQQRINNLT